MMRKIARNGKAKVYLAFDGEKIYHDTHLNDSVTVSVLVELSDNYVRYLRGTDTLEEVVELLDIIRPRFAGFDYDEKYNELLNVNNDVKKAMQICEINGEDQIDVGGIKGLRISNY